MFKGWLPFQHGRCHILNIVFVWGSEYRLSGFYVMQYTAFAVAIVWSRFYMKKRFRDFARISNLNHFFQLDHCCIIIVVVIDKNYIYICRCLFIIMRQNFKSIISCSEHKALGFLSIVQFTVLLICFKP